jgi:hypothetical protein
MEDFDSFLGRSTFNSILAVVVQKEYRGQPTFDLIVSGTMWFLIDSHELTFGRIF